MEIALLFAALVAGGLFAGLIAGLFGIGGGVVIVPALYQVMLALGYQGPVLHVAVATSLASIIATSFVSLNAHRDSGAVDEQALKDWIPWVALGSALGALAAGLAFSKSELQLFFGIAGLLVAANFIFGGDHWKIRDDLPTGPARGIVGVLIGGASAMMGVGGGSFGATMMTLCGRSIHQAVATASGFGAAIGIPAVIAFVITGWNAPGRPPFSLGFVNVPGFVLVGLLTTFMAPYGARLAHRLDKQRLRRLFGIAFAIISAKMLYDGLTGR